MPTKYYGVFCRDCGRFKHLGNYEAKYPEEIGSHFTLDHPTELQCTNPECGRTSVYQQSDIAHSVSPDGKEPQYPHR